MTPSADVIVVGGGVIGVCSAYYLARRGRDVLLVEENQIGSGCSYANACAISPSHAVPVPAPGVITQALKWMFQPDSPLLIRLRPDRQLLSWLIRFAASCRLEPARRAIPVLRDLGLASRELFEELIATEGLDFGYQHRGVLYVYKTEAGRQKGVREAELLRQHGLKPRILDAGVARQMEPALVGQIAGAVFYEEDAHGDCHRFVTGLAQAAGKLGVRILTQTKIVALDRNGAGRIRVRAEGADFCASDVVLAMGAWTPGLGRTVGLKIPLEPGKGYSITMDKPPASPRLPMVNVERRVYITPLGDRLRFGGTMEFAGWDATLNVARADAVLRGGLELLGPVPVPQNVQQWCGLRPCTPDGLPVIGRAPTHPHVYVATGHGMLGYTLGPITGKLMSEMITGSPLSLNATALRADRF